MYAYVHAHTHTHTSKHAYTNTRHDVAGRRNRGGSKTPRPAAKAARNCYAGDGQACDTARLARADRTLVAVNKQNWGGNVSVCVCAPAFLFFLFLFLEARHILLARLCCQGLQNKKAHRPRSACSCNTTHSWGLQSGHGSRRSCDRGGGLGESKAARTGNEVDSSAEHDASKGPF